MEEHTSTAPDETLEEFIRSLADNGAESNLEDFSPAPTNKKRFPWGKLIATFVCIVLVVALVFGSCYITARYMDRYWELKTQKYYDSVNGAMANFIAQQEKPKDQQSPVVPEKGEYLTPAQVYSKNVNAVVAISNQGTTTNIFGQVSETASSGTGFIISEDGYIVSNYHVVAGANVLHVITADKTEYDAKVIGYDESNDLAVLKIEAEGLAHATIGSSDALVEGDQVAAIGNPLGELTSTLTVGYISAKNRTVNTDGSSMEMLQTDAAINSGNSGGPLFNMYGDVVGITTAKYSGTSNAGATIEGIGFAIPIDAVIGLIDDLREFGYIKSGYLGVMVQDVSATTAEQYGLPLGALVSEVTPGGCAEAAGIMAKDIITHLGNQRIESISQLTRLLGKYEGGEQTVITVYRSGQTLNLPIVLDSKPQQTQSSTPENNNVPNPFG